MTDPASSRASQWLAAWHSRRPTLALMGEYSSGKSALLNCLLGRALLPTKVTATDLPAVWITKGPVERVYGLRSDGRIDDLTLDDLNSPGAMDYLVIRVETDAPLLDRTDIIDTPGISDPKMTTAIVEEIAKYTDVVIWCSPMNQAWRQSELAFWRAMPDRLKGISLLALTRADLMRSASDTAKVVSRCVTETRSQFAAVLPVSAATAFAALALPVGPDRDRQLTESGFADLQAATTLIIGSAERACATRAKIDPPEEKIVVPPPVLVLGDAERAAVKKTRKPAKRAPDKTNHPEVAFDPETILSAVKNLSQDEHMMTTISHLFSQVSKDSDTATEHRNVLALALTIRTGAELDNARLLKQIQNEVADFAESSWCDLGIKATGQ